MQMVLYVELYVSVTNSSCICVHLSSLLISVSFLPKYLKEISFNLQASCVEYVIMMSDNLSTLFPNMYMDFAGIHLDCHQIFSITATLIVLPTVWLRDLSLLSYLSGSISIFVFLSLIHYSTISSSLFRQHKKLIVNLTIAADLYAYVFSWRSRRINYSCSLLVMDWGDRQNWISSNWNSSRPCKLACCNWYIWFRLLWPFSFSKYLLFYERTIKVSNSFNYQVNWYFMRFLSATNPLRSFSSILQFETFIDINMTC